MNELFIYHLIHSCGFNYQFYDEPKSMSPVEASVLSPRTICIHLAVEHHHWDSSQASQTQNTKNRIIFSPPPTQASSSSCVHCLSKWCWPHIFASQKPESYPRLLVQPPISSPSPAPPPSPSSLHTSPLHCPATIDFRAFIHAAPSGFLTQPQIQHLSQVSPSSQDSSCSVQCIQTPITLIISLLIHLQY